MTKIGIVRLWPNQATAEHENIQRIKMAAQELGVQVVELDRNGYHVDNPLLPLQSGEVEFVIHLHFESPKCYPAYSYVALWNPLRFYFDWGYERFSENLLSHDDFLSCGSTWADDHLLRVAWHRRDINLPLPFLNHTVGLSIEDESLWPKHPKIFYAGINWERIDRSKGRHHEVLRYLDDRDIVRIYGPKTVRGVEVWAGFKCYQGPIPFDGVSLIRRISECGISLVLSSPAHLQSGLMSNRLFESIAAGAVVICDDNRFAQDNFGDSLLYVSPTDDTKNLARQILNHYSWIVENPEKARRLALKARDIFRQQFELKHQLRQILSSHGSRVQAQENKLLATTQERVVHVIIPIYDLSPYKLKSLLLNVGIQRYRNCRVHIMLDSSCSEGEKRTVEQIVKNSQVIGDVRYLAMYTRNARISLGHLIGESIHDLPLPDAIIVMNEGELWDRDHISMLVRILEDKPQARFAISDYVLKHKDKKGQEFRDYFSAARHLDDRHEVWGTYLASRSLLERPRLFSFLNYLHGHRYFAALRMISGEEWEYTHRPTVLRDISDKREIRYEVEEDVQDSVLRECSVAFGGRTSSINKRIMLEYDNPFAKLVDAHSRLSLAEKNSLSLIIMRYLPLPGWLTRVALWTSKRILKLAR